MILLKVVMPPFVGLVDVGENLEVIAEQQTEKILDNPFALFLKHFQERYDFARNQDRFETNCDNPSEAYLSSLTRRDSGARFRTNNGRPSWGRPH